MTKSIAGAALAQICCSALADKKASDIRVLDVSEVSSITDFMIVATATSDPHLRALRVEMERVIDAAEAHIVGIEAPTGSGWVVVDTFDVMIHLFLPESRDKYRLETLWKDAIELKPDNLLSSKELPKKSKKKVTKKPKASKPSTRKTVGKSRRRT